MHRETAKRSFFLDCKEGISQGYPMSIILYGILLLPFITKLKILFPNLFLPWFADSGLGRGNLDSLHKFFNKACELGDAYGYYPKIDKSILIINNNNKTKAEILNAQYKHSFEIKNRHRF